MDWMTEVRTCDQCGTLFAPRREHARFCTARCRVAWNRRNASAPELAEVSALAWSITAMCDAAERLPRVRAWDRPRAMAAIGEVVWWVTIVDGTLIRYHPVVYDSVMREQAPEQRRLTEQTLAGLRFVRNRMGHHVDHVAFIEPAPDGAITAWTWRSMPCPALAALPPSGQEWEMTRYEAYQACLAGRPVGDVFKLASAFLKQTAAKVTAAMAEGEHAARGAR